MQRKLYQELACLVEAYQTKVFIINPEVKQQHLDKITALVKDNMPFGSGFDRGTDFNIDDSNSDKLVFTTSFHHMDEHGFYDDWTDHNVTVKPSLLHGFVLKISGNDRNEIKDYIYSVFREALLTEV